MVCNDRLLEIKSELQGAKQFFARVLDALPNDGCAELRDDIASAPEFFDEIADIVAELMEHRNLTEYKKELRAIIPEISNGWVRREGGVVRQIWKDIVGVVSG